MHESLRERERLLTLAPHLVEPLELCIPVYRGARRKRWQIGVGLALYDLLSAGKSLPKRRLFGRDELLAHMPGLNRDGLVGGASYYDAQVRYPERLVVENVRDAVAHGAVLETYARVTRVRVERGRATGVEWQSARGRGGARAPLIVNAAGPVGRRGARADSAHAPDRRHEGQPHRRAAVRRRAAQRRLRRGRRRSPAVLHPAVERAAADRHDRRALRRRPGCGRRSMRASARTSSARPSACFPAPPGSPSRVLYTHTGVRPLPYQAARCRGRHHAPAYRSPPSCRARALLDRRRQAHDASRARRGRAAQAARRAAAARGRAR